MSWETIKAAVNTTLSTVSGIGNVHQYRRQTAFWDKYFAAHKTLAGKINTWEITRGSIGQEIAVPAATALHYTTHDVLILGHYAVNDATPSDTVWQNLLSAIVAAFKADEFLGGTVIFPRQLQVPRIDFEMFGGVLCHVAECHFEAIERE